jgi:hypothetical protein
MVGAVGVITFCPASRFVTVDNEEARKPPLAILLNVKENGRMTSGNKTQSRSCPHIHKTRNSKKEEFKLC